MFVTSVLTPCSTFDILCCCSRPVYIHCLVIKLSTCHCDRGIRASWVSVEGTLNTMGCQWPLAHPQGIHLLVSNRRKLISDHNFFSTLWCNSFTILKRIKNTGNSRESNKKIHIFQNHCNVISKRWSQTKLTLVTKETGRFGVKWHA